ncbi:MAG TPA: co-chaperone DjlA [Gammaproteobacteria bacterium]|jgi:DnaJ like chaperone protein|nr:co-chaperone DjlA [Gammaproteobacteria bacterium]
MSWWGKLIGGSFGFVLGGPLGALLGVALGHNFDRGLKQLDDDFSGHGRGADPERVQLAFFTATFSVMGHVAKADGQVSRDEIDHAQAVMASMQLNPDMRKTAINLFNAGKQGDFDLEAVMAQFRQEAGRRTNLYRMFMEIQIQAAYADGTMHDAERKVLVEVSELLGLPAFVFRQLEALVRASMGQEQAYGGGGGQRRARADSGGLTLNEAYSILGVTSSDSAADVKRAYRRMLSQHHPDKLVAKGLPEEMIKLANEKTAQLAKAYDLIKSAKGW